MPSLHQRRGGQAEHRAVLYLLRHKYVIIQTHYTCRYGEIDILAQDGETIVAVEVKARRTSTFGRSVESLSQKKYFRLLLTLQTYLSTTHQEQAPHRIDLIAIDGRSLRHLRAIDIPGETP